VNEWTVRKAAGVSRASFLRRVLVVASGAGLLAACGAPAPPTPAAPAKTAAAGSAPAGAAQGAPGAGATPTTGAATTAPSAQTTAAAGQPRAGGTYSHGSAQEPDRFWGPFSGLVVSYEIAQLTNAPLIKINDKLEYVPYLAVEVPTTQNGGIGRTGSATPSSCARR
jgi:hypothetical protein